MRTRQIDGIDTNWSAITLGCWQLAPSGGWGDVCPPDTADRVVKTALDAGITAFDTAEGYGGGESERRLGRALGQKKYDVIVVSKIWPDAELNLQSFQERMDGTLQALDRDYVDLYLVHWPGDFFNSPEKTEKLSELMFRLRATGKTRALGLSNFKIEDLERMGEGLSRYAVNEVPLNLLEREYEGEARELCRRRGVGYLAYSPTALGFLARKMTGPDLDFPARRHEDYFHEPLRSHALKVFNTVEEIAGELGVKPIQVALGWVLAQENILTAIVGSRQPEQVLDLEAAGDLELGRDSLDRLTAASDAFHEIKSSI